MTKLLQSDRELELTVSMAVHPLACDTVTCKKAVWTGFEKKPINQGLQLATVSTPGNFRVLSTPGVCDFQQVLMNFVNGYRLKFQGASSEVSESFVCTGASLTG